MAKKKSRKMSFRGKVKKDTQNHQKSGSKYDVIKLPDGVELYKPTAGTAEFDIIPYIVTADNHPDKDSFDFDGVKETIAHKDDVWYKRPYKVHKDVGADNITVICLESFGKPCPICEYRKAQQAKGVDWEEIKMFKPKDRVLYAIKPVKIKGAKDAFYILDMSFYLFQNKLDEETNEDEDFEDFPMLEGGYTLKVRWKEGDLSKKGREYFEASRIDFKERGEDYDESILDKVPDLDNLLIELPYEKVKALFYEDDVDSDEENEDEEEPPFKEDDKPVKKAKNKKPAKKEEKEDEEMDWEGLQELDLNDLSDMCETYDIDAEEIADDEEDEDVIADLLRKAIAEEVGIEIPKPKKKETTKKQAKKATSKKTKDPICPEEGMTFGVDTDESEACDDCEFLQACIKKNEEA